MALQTHNTTGTMSGVHFNFWEDAEEATGPGSAFSEAAGEINNRILQVAANISTDVPTSAPIAEVDVLVTSNDSDIIRETLRVYGSLYVLFFFLFCFLRSSRRYGKYFNIRSWVPDLKCDLAITQDYGFFSWAWKVFYVSDDDLLKQCGMDALCFLRCLRLGGKLCFFGALNSVYLIPLYVTAKDSPETEYLQDNFVLMSIANLPASSERFAAAVLASYLSFFYTIRLITKEYDFFIEYRHKFMSMREPRNYAVYVSGIPPELRSSFALADFFRKSSWNSAVLESHIAMDIPKLEAKVARREKVIAGLEHAIAEEKLKGVTKMHRTFNLQNSINSENFTEKVESVETYRKELRRLNHDISFEVGKITNVNDRMRHNLMRAAADSDILRGRILTAESVAIPPNEEGAAQEEAPRSLMEDTSEYGIETFETVPTSSRLLDPIMEDIHNGPCTPPKKEEEWHPADIGLDDQMYDIENYPTLPEIESTPQTELERKDSRVHPFLTLMGLGDVFEKEKAGGCDTMSVLTPSASASTNSFPSKESSCHEDYAKELTDDTHALEELDTRPEEEEVDFEERIEEEDSEPPKRELAPHRKMQVDPDSFNSIEASDSENSERLSGSGRGLNRKSGKISTSFTRARENMSRQMNTSMERGASAVSKDSMKEGVRKVGTMSKQGAMKVAEFGVARIVQAPKLAATLVETGARAASAVAPMLFKNEYGAPREAGFVVFRDVYTTQAALQMLQHPSANRLLVEPAPPPDEIFWRNVGLPVRARKTGRLLSLAATITLCFFWSIPIAFVSSLTEVNSLKEKLPALGELIENAPWMEKTLALIAPILLLALNEGLLPPILTWFATWEGLVGSPALEASVFVKLSAFVIIQTFFVSAVSGSISAELSNILDDPEKIVDLLANSLPAQSSYFIQIVLVFTFFFQGLELLRVYPLGMALLRRFIGPNLTAKERRKRWKFIYSLEDPPEFFHAEVFSQIVLLYVTNFVYATIAPISCTFIFVCYVILESGFRYHFIHNHPTTPDSGGIIFKGFMNVLMVSMLIGQFTLIGYMALKKVFYAIPAMSPLPIMTILYMATVLPKRIHVSNFLPTVTCVELDRQYQSGENNDEFIRKKYLQPALQHPKLFPDEDQDF